MYAVTIDQRVTLEVRKRDRCGSRRDGQPDTCYPAVMLVYRDGVRRVRASCLRRELSDRLLRIESDSSRWATLLLAGELEAGLEDAGARSANVARELTDKLASGWLSGALPEHRALAEKVASLAVPSEVDVTRPEGYAYYALDPSSYARWVSDRGQGGPAVVVVGIRSIGTSLSAVACAAARQRGMRALRLTVRPQGHPWDRRWDPDAEMLQLVRSWPEASYWVVDEGPGLSGSTFLAVGEGLQRAGVDSQRIELVTSHEVAPATLIARDAERRWKCFRATSVLGRPLPAQALDLGAGAWRGQVYATEAEWPASWASMERRKYRLPGSSDIIRFVGFPPYGEAPLARATLLAEAGFSPAMREQGPGYAVQAWCTGRPLRLDAPRAVVLPRILDYLVYRSRACRAERDVATAQANTTALSTMLRVNVAEALQADLPRTLRLEVERPVFADGRLLPHEWIRARDGVLMKVDATDHGDDHLLPGPCDTAWDLAGTAVEWQLSAREAEHFFERYSALAGDDVKARIRPYLLAYAAFRVAYVQIAALTALPAERTRLARERQRYLSALRLQLARAGATAARRSR